MRGKLALIGLLWMLAPIATAADRSADFENLNDEYLAATKAFHDRPQIEKPTIADHIRRYESWPGWDFARRFVALADAEPSDETAFRCCLWIIQLTTDSGNSDRAIFGADQRVWEILAKHRSDRDELPMLCFNAAQYVGPAQEQFLRILLKRQHLSRESAGFATVALAELLAQKCEYLENPPTQATAAPGDDFMIYQDSRRATDWGKDLVPENLAKFKSEGIELFRDALVRYADIPVTISAPGFRNLKSLGEKAGKSLHALEHLSLGAEAPATVGTDFDSQPLDLQRYRGRVVVLTFWNTGCSPCLAMIPQEKRLIETYRDRPFALLGVCTDAELARGQQTAAAHQMTWPCWFDTANGPIAQAWNVLSLPTVIVLDEHGRIVAKNLRGEQLDAKVAELMRGK
jgi:thiol-disulfide isomerase/thioredoxin